MAENEARRSYPTLPVSQWWALRKRFKQSIPGVVTDSYLAAALGMGIPSARTNVLPHLRTLGIIDAEGKPTERAKLWRDDEHYAEICQTIVDIVYPEELRHAVPNPSAERERAARWFAQDTGAGENAVSKMVGIYAVLIDADVTKQPDGEKKAQAAKAPSKATSPRKQPPTASGKRVDHVERLNSPEGDGDSGHHHRSPLVPEVNVNLQIHISADASPDQIDQIFASMAKHLYKGK